MAQNKKVKIDESVLEIFLKLHINEFQDIKFHHIEKSTYHSNNFVNISKPYSLGAYLNIDNNILHIYSISNDTHFLEIIKEKINEKRI